MLICCCCCLATESLATKIVCLVVATVCLIIHTVTARKDGNA